MNQPSKNSSALAKSPGESTHPSSSPTSSPSLSTSFKPRPIASHQEEWFSDWESFSERVGETQAQARSGLEVGEQTKSKNPTLANPAKVSQATKTSKSTSEGVFRSQIFVDGMHCSACSLNVEKAIKALPGIQSAHVNAATSRAEVVWDAGTVTPAKWLAAIVNAGYSARPASDWREEKGRNREGRLALWRLLVAGFCMMQVMMYSYPTYISNEGDMSDDVTLLLRWASWVLTLPVIVFSCTPFWKNAWRDIRRSQISMDLPVALGILITFIVSTASTFDDQGVFGNQVYFDSLTMFVFFLLASRWLEVKMRNKTAGSLEMLTRRMPAWVERQNGQGVFERIAAKDLKVSDIVRIHPTETFPCDGVLIDQQTWVEESLMTGESKPVLKEIGSSVLAGSHNLSQSVTVKVKALGKETRFAEIVKLMEQASLNKPNIVLIADRFATPFLWGVLLLAVLSSSYWAVFGSWGAVQAVMVGVSVLIVTCPCALSLAAPAAMLAATGNLARHAVFVRDLNSFEKMAGIQTVIFDKTGTLTRDGQQLQDIYTPEGVLHIANAPSLSTNQALALKTAASLAAQSWHPLSRALSKSLSEMLSNSLPAQKWIDPNSQNNSLGIADSSPISVKETAGQGLEGRSASNQLYRLGSLEFCEALNTNVIVPSQAQSSQIHFADKTGWLASFSLSENLREDAKASINALREMGLSIEVLSGDQPRFVGEVALALNIPEHAYKAKCTPFDKLNRVGELQKSGLHVATVGDGFNDMPALAKSDVSFAFGHAVPFAQAKADVVVLSNKLWTVTQSLMLAKKTMRVVKGNFIWAGLYNIICIPLAVIGWLPPWASGIGMALSSTIVILNSLQLARASALIEP